MNANADNMFNIISDMNDMNDMNDPLAQWIVTGRPLGELLEAVPEPLGGALLDLRLMIMTIRLILMHHCYWFKHVK